MLIFIVVILLCLFVVQDPQNDPNRDDTRNKEFFLIFLIYVFMSSSLKDFLSSSLGEMKTEKKTKNNTTSSVKNRISDHVILWWVPLHQRHEDKNKIWAGKNRFFFNSGGKKSFFFNSGGLCCGGAFQLFSLCLEKTKNHFRFFSAFLFLSS